MEDDGIVVSPIQESEAVLRIRPIKTSRVGDGTVPSTSYLEETWKDEPMTPAGRLFIDSTFDCVCVCILGFKEPIEIELFKKHVEMTIMKHKRFSSKVETRNGRPWWTQVKANVNDHVLETQFTTEQKADKDFVLNYTTDVILHKPFDKSKPLWDIHVLDVSMGEAVSCAVVRIHHALGDGTSLISLLMACTRKSGKPDALPTLATGSKTEDSSIKPCSFFTRFFHAVFALLVVFWYSLTEIGKFVASLMWLKDNETPIKGASGCQLLPKKYRFATIDVDDLKFVSKAVGGTMNDVFIAMASIGLRRYMDYRIEKDAFIEGNKISSAKEVDSNGKEQINTDGLKAELNANGKAKSAETTAKLKKLDKARVRALALINTRPTPGLPELADMMTGAASQARWGNHMGYLLLELPMKHQNPLERVREAMAIGNRKKSSLEGPFTYASGSLTMSILGEKIATKLVYRSAVHTTLSMSNVKGPSQEVMFGENPITHIIPSVIGQPHALCLHLQSYNGQIFLVGMAAKEIIPDPEYVLQLCVDALQEMKKAAAKALASK